MSRAGALLDSPPLVISGSAGTQRNPSVASDGTRFLVVWEDARDGPNTQVFASRVSSAGAVGDPSGRALTGGAGTRANPDLAWDGATFLVVFDKGGTIFAKRVTSAAAVLDSAGITVSAAAGLQFDPAVAKGPSDALVVWTDSRGGVFGARSTGRGRRSTAPASASRRRASTRTWPGTAAPSS